MHPWLVHGIYSHYASLLWPTLMVATSSAIPSSVGSSIGWPPLLETDFAGSGFWACFFSSSCFPLLLSGFYFGGNPLNIYSGFRFPFPASPPFFLSLRRSLPLSLSVPIALTAAAAATTDLCLPGGVSRTEDPAQYGPPCHSGGPCLAAVDPALVASQTLTPSLSCPCRSSVRLRLRRTPFAGYAPPRARTGRSPRQSRPR